MSLFVLGAFVAYSIAYLQGDVENVSIFLTKIIIPIIFIILPFTLAYGVLLTLLIQTGRTLHNLLKSYRIKI